MTALAENNDMICGTIGQVFEQVHSAFDETIHRRWPILKEFARLASDHESVKRDLLAREGKQGTENLHAKTLQEFDFRGMYLRSLERAVDDSQCDGILPSTVTRAARKLLGSEADPSSEEPLDWNQVKRRSLLCAVLETPPRKERLVGFENWLTEVQSNYIERLESHRRATEGRGTMITSVPWDQITPEMMGMRQRLYPEEESESSVD
jgi:hypothetical protein